jgi:aquaporin Z
MTNRQTASKHGQTITTAGFKGKAMTLRRRATAEFFGTFWLVFGGCGSAVLAAAFPNLGIGFAGVALAFGLTVLTMAYAIGHISGCHLNPAVTAGLVAGGRFPASECGHYMSAQVAGGIVGSGFLYLIASGKAGFDLSGGFAAWALPTNALPKDLLPSRLASD